MAWHRSRSLLATAISRREYDSVTGLYYSMARWYDPGTGRFVSEDRYMGALADPLSQNRYVYASDNPLRYADPTGRMVVNRPIFGGDTPWSLAEYQENLWAQENDYWVEQRDSVGSGAGCPKTSEECWIWETYLTEDGYTNGFKLANIVATFLSGVVDPGLAAIINKVANAALTVLTSLQGYSDLSNIYNDWTENDEAGIGYYLIGLAGDVLNSLQSDLQWYDYLTAGAASAAFWGLDLLTVDSLDLAVSATSIAASIGEAAQFFASANLAYQASFAS